jgi:very-short-patch-repair endonuclease
MLARMFDRRCHGYEAVGYSISLPASAVPGWPADLVLASDLEWKRDYAATVRRLIRDGVDTPLANLFVRAVKPSLPEARGVERKSAQRERSIFCQRLETLPETKGRFQLNVGVPIAFDGQSQMEADLFNEPHGSQHLSDPEAYRRDRRKDRLLQQNSYLVLRFLAEDVGKDLDGVLDSITAVFGRARTVEVQHHACNENYDSELYLQRRSRVPFDLRPVIFWNLDNDSDTHNRNA